MREVIGLVFVIAVLGAGAVTLLLGYFLPTIVVLVRRPEEGVWETIILNVFLGWTLVGWVCSLVMSVGGTSTPAYLRHRPPTHDHNRGGASIAGPDPKRQEPPAYHASSETMAPRASA